MSSINSVSPLPSYPSSIDGGHEDTFTESKEPKHVHLDGTVSPPPNYTPESNWITSKEICRIRQLPYMNGMRALATIMIEYFHISRADSPYVYYFTWIAMTIHFVQGAFLITGSLLALQSKSKSTYSHLPQFFANRWARLYPAVIVVMLLNSIWWMMRYHDIQHLAKTLIRVFFKISQTNLLAVPNYPPNPWANQWFLEVQEHFYIFWALILPFIAKLTTRGRIVCLLLLFIISFRQRLSQGLYNATLFLNLYKMVCGASLYLLPLPKVFVTRYAGQAAILLSILGFFWGISPRFVHRYTEDQHRMYGDNIGIAIIALVIMAAIGKSINDSDPEYQRQRKEHIIKRTVEAQGQHWVTIKLRYIQDYEFLDLLDVNWLNFIGRISYSWYLWQIPLMHLEGKFRSGWSGFGPTCEAFVLSIISTFAIEEPIRNAYAAYLKRQNITIAPSPSKAAQVTAGSSTFDQPNSYQMPFGSVHKNQVHKE